MANYINYDTPILYEEWDHSPRKKVVKSAILVRYYFYGESTHCVGGYGSSYEMRAELKLPDGSRLDVISKSIWKDTGKNRSKLIQKGYEIRENI